MRKLVIGLVSGISLLLLGLYFLTAPIFGKVQRDRNLHFVVSADSLKAHVLALTATPLPRNYENIQTLDSVAAYIKHEFESYGLTSTYQEYQADGRTYRNVVASYGPANAPVIVVGAHYDVCEDHQGADDNASGIAGLLEFSRLLASQKPDLKYRIELVAYTLEEPPFFRTAYMGSAVHAKSLLDQKVEIKAMVCLEMIGYFSDAKKSQDYPVAAMKAIYPTTGNFIAVVGRTGEDDLVKAFKKKMLSASSLPVESINAPPSVQGIDFSDHLNYWKYDIPAIMITNTSFYRNKNYHTAGDVPATLDYVRMAEVVKGVYAGVVGMI